MVWDVTKPAGSRALNLGDDDMREFKVDVQAALQAQGSFPGADTSNPRYKWTPEMGNTAARPATNLVTGQLYLNTQTKALERYNGSSWDLIDLSQGSVLAAVLAGLGLVVNGSALDVNVDGSTLEISSDVVRVKDSGISTAKIANSAVDENKIAGSVAGNGLSGGGGSALAVNVDGSTLEISGDSLRIKDGGVTNAKIDSVAGSKLIINTTSFSASGDFIPYAFPLGMTIDLAGAGLLSASAWTATYAVITFSSGDPAGPINASLPGTTITHTVTGGHNSFDSSTLYYFSLPHPY